MQRRSGRLQPDRGLSVDQFCKTAEHVEARAEADEIAVGHASLIPLLNELDLRLAAAVQAADRVFAARAAGDLYRGLAITPADVRSALGRDPGEPLFPLCRIHSPLAELPDSLSIQRLHWLRHTFSLTDLDVDAILIGLAPEVDLRYERLYAYLQDDVTRRRPSIDLALNLLCHSGVEKLRQRERFAPNAPLIHHQLIELLAEPHQPHSPLLARYFRLDDQIVRFLLLDDGLDNRLAEFCRVYRGVSPQSKGPVANEIGAQLQALLSHRPGVGIRLYFQGPGHCGQDDAVRLLAAGLDSHVLEADFSKLPVANAMEIPGCMSVLVREAWLHGALLHVKGLDIGESSLQGGCDALWRALDRMPVDCVLEAGGRWLPGPPKPPGVLVIGFTYPAVAQRQAWWRYSFDSEQLAPDESVIVDLARRYRMTYAQIRDAVAVAAGMLRSLATSDSPAPDSDLVSRIACLAARAQSGYELAALTTKIEPHATWADLILPNDETAQLHEICARFNYRDQVFNEWGFAGKISYGRGITALFSGGSGTGKTMAAEVIANALSLDLYRIDLSQMVSKYIGETEKNLDALFAAAENANAILFFDEADALFGKRTEIKDSHDRYANLEISYLLQKMEQYEGIAILATNLADNLDQAFIRRLGFQLYFPFPDEESRLRIWQRIWPADIALTPNVDLVYLAREIRLTGGHIRNIALSAAFLAAARGGSIDMQTVVAAACREYRKAGGTEQLSISLNTDIGPVTDTGRCSNGRHTST